MDKQVKRAIFAGGCFWCMVEPFDEKEGIISVVSGYTGGRTANPTYEEVCSNTTGHYEAVEITYDEALISYEDLLNLFWQQIDPTDAGGQFNDRGESYKTAIFYLDDKQKALAEKSREELEASGKFKHPIVTEIKEAKPFYQAEEGHQDYYKKNPLHYNMYKEGSGRADFIKKTWQKKDDESLKSRLTQMQYYVTQEDGTEPPFQNEYWDNEEEGIYVDVVSGEVLFSSKDKFDAQCGWPSFTKPVHNEEIIEKADMSHGMIRTEVRSKTADSHLGHVFPDGPKDKGGLRYCINSAATTFINKADMAEKGYSDYLYLFD